MVVAGGLLALGSTLYGAFQGGQQRKAYESAVEAAGLIKEERLDVLEKQRGLTTSMAQEQYKAGVGSVGFGTNIGLRRTQAFGETAYSKSDMATVGSIDTKIKQQTGDILAKYQSQMQKLVSTRKFKKESADLAYRSGEISAEAAYQSTIGGMDPGGAGQGAIEGFFSAANLLL